MDKTALLPKDVIHDFCHRWKIIEFSLFGSILRNDFGPDSDIDALVTFAPDARWSLLDHIRMEKEIEARLGRRVDLVSKKALSRSGNFLRRKAILESAQVFHATG